MKHIFPIAVLAFATSSTFAASDTRSQAMGGTNVASSNYLSASLANPALISKTAKKEDDFGIILPSLNIQVQDKGELFDNIDKFQDSFDELSELLNDLENGIPPSQEELVKARARLAANLAQLDSLAFIEGNLAIAIASPNRYGGMALHFNTEFDLLANVDIDATDIENIATALTPDELDTLNSEAQFVGASISELGFSYGREQKIKGYTFNWGITPKFQQVDIFNYVVSVQEFDDDEFDANEYLETESKFNLDLGFAMGVYKNTTIGLTVSNLFKNEFVGVEHRGRKPLYVVEPEFKIGAAYTNDVIIVSADLDLNSAEKLSLEEDSQFIRAGIELNGYDWVQLRFGYAHDFKGPQDDFLSIGLGLSPFNTVKFDITAQKAGDNEYGLGAQFALTF